MVRDQALAASGLLGRKLGGPSVFPVQPAGLWQAAFNGERTWSTVYVEAAQALARRIVREGGQGIANRARYGLELCLCRPARTEQVEPLVSLFTTEYDRYRKDGIAATALATEPLGPMPPGMEPAELAAWTAVANVLLNLDGVLTKG
jgi:hypothetical protein